MTALLDRYRQDVERAGWQHDPEQVTAIAELQRIDDELSKQRFVPAPKEAGFFARLFGHGNDNDAKQGVKGLYLWGGVGRGKTYLMDLFYASLSIEAKRRLHFHRFMQQVHKELKSLRQQQVQEPLKSIGKTWAEQARIICLDEFFVSDITDAMLLAGLLEALFQHGVTLVTTSNCKPDDLYKNGLQRARFLPAIELLNTRLQVLHLAGNTDYRLRYLEQAELFHVPLDDMADVALQEAFNQLQLNPEPSQPDTELDIEGRAIAVKRLGEGVVWFEFSAICDGPRSQADYIEIARYFHTVLIANIPVMDKLMEDQARRFLSLVDEFYDRNVTLIVSAAAPITEIYQGERLRFEYQRTISRLQEMQSYDYLARQHLP